MAQTHLVTVNGEPFATVTTSANAHMLKDKINKYLPGAAEVPSTELLYNPKHVDALEALGVDPDGPVPAPRKVAAQASRKRAGRVA